MFSQVTIFSAAILGVIEGLTEFLPVSSTGHLILASRLLGLPDSEFVKSFEVVIQLGAIMAVAILYWRQFLVNRRVLARVLVAFGPTALIGLLVYPLVKQYLLGSVTVTLASLFIGGLLLIFYEKKIGEKENPLNSIEDLSFRQAVYIGLAQAVAIVPGVSRSAATIVGGLALGLSRRAIVEFSFLLAVPTMAAAVGLDLLKTSGGFTTEEYGLLVIGLMASFAVAWLAVKTFLAYIQKHDFVVFGAYRLVLSLILAIAFFS